jgi:G3E family GTPase
MTQMRFVMLGGFLGAGKTTALARLARHYQDRGLRVGLVTNDQAQGLVDTASLRSQGFAVEEVPGACFCCRFDDLVGRVGRLEESERPDVILAEPVGSCTDLVATVVRPLKALYGDRFAVAPYAVLFKPSHGLRILRNESAGFSPKAAYIFRKQLEEADAVVINRADELSADELDELRRRVRSECPDSPVLVVSAKTGEGFDGLTDLLDREGEWGRKVLEIDYDTYAEGEAELGWLNATARLEASAPLDLDAVTLAVVSRLAEALRVRGGEVAHLKVIGLDDTGDFAVANLVSSITGPELSLASRQRVPSAELVVNARVADDPAVLAADVRSAVAAVAAQVGATVEWRAEQHLRPGRPVPTHRMVGV